jgi:hypothetical protein
MTRLVRTADDVAAVSAACFFLLFIASSQLPTVRATSAWADDPYDAVISVVALILPVVALITWLRGLRWRSPRAIPVAALRQLLRGATVVWLLVGAGLLACLAALVAAGGLAAVDRLPPIVVVLLVITTLAAATSLLAVTVAWRTIRPVLGGAVPGLVPDLFDDVEALATGIVTASATPPAARRAVEAGAAATRRLARPIRAAPWRSCLVLAVAFGSALSVWHSVAEGLPSTAAGFVILPVYAAFGTGIVIVAYASVGRYLELIRHERH